MAEILKDWLSQTLERPVTWEACKEFGNMMKNGHVIATVLRSYHVINDEKHYIIRASNEEADIKNNWKHLREWLKEVEVNLTDEDLNNIMMGKGSSLLRLFYQLFLHLDKRDRINFIKRERKMVSSLVEKLENRFTVKKVTEESEPFVDYLSKPLLDERQFIEWQKRKAKEIKESFDYLHHKYSKIIGKIEDSKFQKPIVKKGSQQTPKKNEDIDKFERQHPCKYQNYTYEELMALEEKAMQRKKSLVDSEWTNEYMNNLFQRIRKRSDSDEFQRQIASALSNSLWNACVAEEESKGDMELAKKVMKLSQFEKQMCTQIMETKQQARNLVKNRIQGEIEYTEQREQQLNIFFDNLKDKIDSGVVEIDFEQKRQNQLHKRLFAEKMKRKRQIYYDICYETLLALIDYAVKFGYFKKLMEDDVPQHFIHEWKCLFFKQQPIFEVLTPTEDILKLRDAEESSSFTCEEIVYVERDRQQVLNDCEFQEYLDYLYPWNLDVLIPNYDPESEERTVETLGLKILGHAVYTLLEVKYPYPSKRLPADLPDYTSKVLLRSLPDKSLSSILETLLNSQKIRVVRLESVINYCLREYQIDMIGRTEIQLAYDSFLAATQEEETKELIKSMKSEDEVLAKSRDIDTSGPLLSPLPNTKYTQTPKSLPEDDITMSPAASLGQYAYDALTAGEPLTDYLIAAMIVEYLKHQEDIVGFVIINYPNTYLQVQILEEAFVGFGPPDFEELDDNDDELLEESILKHRLKEIDVYKEVRVSKIVKDPHRKRTDEPFETYFTAYINLKQTIDISDELVIWELTQENSDIIDRFYAVMGINYSLFYEVIDRDLIAQICESFRSHISKEYSEKAKITPTKKKEGNGSNESCNHEEILKENALKCLEEWPVGVNGEMLRFNLRILALQYKCYADMKLFSDQVLKAFIEIQNVIDTYYTNEVLAVDRLCKYFHMAIEKGRKIPESLLLEYDNLIIDNNVIQFAPSVETIVPQSKSEIKRYSNFKTNQLARLRSQFKLVAPTGIIIHKAFIYLLQDFIIFGKESKEGPLFPDVWKNIDPEQVQKLVFSLFGETAYVDWREFLIYCLQLSFPTINELLEVRKKFRCNDLDSTELISRDNFIKEELWFDKDFITEDKQDLLKLNLIKHFLFELYETEEDMMNYSAFLLAFCKNVDPIKGFIAALSMAVGQEICHSLDDCGDIVNYLINDKKYRDECLACALKCTEQFINKLIQRVVSICEGTTVEEVMYTESVPEEKKGKRRKTTRIRKTDGNQSGRSDNSQKRGSQYKMLPSIVVSQAAMICPPCERPVEKPKEPEKEPVVVKPPVEEPPIPYRDPNICLEVSQSVIWNVLKICLPWHFEILPDTTDSVYVQQVEEVLQILERDTDNKDIYVCKLVADPKFCKILHKVKKFTAVDLLEEIITMI
ncbi:Sperm flagellar protein 2 [Papilio xuthus]|uniref:Sperm flagellar protein 2 n=1 Tax=Papilio xuthus TaxID=66420 RepID=A0A194QA96_PAPXU|nr:Sperm flagellar protein 2 [Papilio xuthus]